MMVSVISDSIDDCKTNRLVIRESNPSEFPCYSTYELKKTTINHFSMPLTIEGELNTYKAVGEQHELNMLNGDISNSGTAENRYETIQAFFLIFNVYNINLNTVGTFAVLYEKINGYFYPFPKVEVFYNGNAVDALYILSILLAIVMLVLVFMLLKNDIPVLQKSLFDEKEKEEEKPPLLRIPNFHELLLILNILFFLAIIIFRGISSNNFKLKDKINSNEFVKLHQHCFDFRLVNCLSSMNILLFFLCLYFFFFDLTPAFKNLQNTIQGYLKDLNGFIIGIIIPFILVSFFASYMLFGYYNYREYGHLTFIFSKVIQSLFRGSLDHSEFFNEKKNKFKLFNGFELTMNDSETLYDFVGPTGYILFSLLFFFYSFVFIKGTLVAVCFLKYKNTYLKAVAEKEQELKELKALERKRKNEAKAKELKKKKQKEKERKEIEMQTLKTE
ncbi:MAG: hypothetical protein MJ252_24300 [archaeon]|nr:hypothetical protein [archaeon]